MTQSLTKDDLIIGEEISYGMIIQLFDKKNIVKYGQEIIGEQFIICKNDEEPEKVWSFMLSQVCFCLYYRLIYKSPNQ